MVFSWHGEGNMMSLEENCPCQSWSNPKAPLQCAHPSLLPSLGSLVHHLYQPLLRALRQRPRGLPITNPCIRHAQPHNTARHVFHQSLQALSPCLRRPQAQLECESQTPRSTASCFEKLGLIGAGRGSGDSQNGIWQV